MCGRPSERSMTKWICLLEVRIARDFINIGLQNLNLTPDIMAEE